ncbi:MAG: glycosyltransferase family 39 protein [Planctomycetota bacterium]|nr:MAG: glycosyltransferase family 39 protein [Planctomycetota bacterium]
MCGRMRCVMMKTLRGSPWYALRELWRALAPSGALRCILVLRRKRANPAATDSATFHLPRGSMRRYHIVRAESRNMSASASETGRPRISPMQWALGVWLATLARSWLGGVLLIALCLAAYLPGLSDFPPIDGDEARYVEASRQMLAERTLEALVVPRIDGAPRLNKPPLIYWLQSASAWLLSGGDPARLSYPAALRGEATGQRTLTGSPPTRATTFTGGVGAWRLVSVVATLIAVLITWRLGLQMFAPPVAWLAALLLGGCFLCILDARLARTDQVLLACTAASQWALWHVWRSRPTPLRWVLALWVAIGLGILVKGPVTPAVAVLTVLALGVLTGDWSCLRRARIGLGVAILTLMIAPWVALVIRYVGWDTLWESLARETFGRGLSSIGGRGGPPGYHLVLLPGLFWPGGLLVVPAFLYALRRGLRRADETHVLAGDNRGGGVRAWPVWRLVRPGRPAEMFCLAWIVPAWIACELISTKLPHYTLPLFPPIALLVARAAWAGAAGTLPLVRSKAAAAGDASWVLIGLALLAGAPLYLAWRGALREEPGVVVALAATIILVVSLLMAAWVVVRQRRFVAALLIGCGVSTLGGYGLFQTVLPNLRKPWVNSEIVRDIARIDPAGARPLAAVGYYLESLEFLTGGRIERIAPAQLDAWLDRHPTGLAVAVEGAYHTAQPIRVVAREAGFNYIEGDSIVLDLIEPLTAAQADDQRRAPQATHVAAVHQRQQP